MSEKETHNDFSYFYKLELKGINCFKEDVKLDLSDGRGGHASWTIILGDNGTGKTTLLRVLDRMQPSELNRNYSPILWTSKFGWLETQPLIILKTKNDLKIYKGLPDGFSVPQGNLDFPFLVSYGASRRMSKNQNIIIKEDKNSLRITSLLDESKELINAEEWLLQKELLAEKAEPSVKAKFENQFTLVKNLLIDILPDVQDIRLKPINETNSKLLVEVETDYGWVNLRDLSFGYQTLTALIVDIAAKMMEQYPDSANPLAEPVIILIDEIDLHLHPKWQRTVIDKLSEHFPAAQFIATSHSPLIVQAAQDKGANIVVCRKEGDRVVIDNNPDEVKGWRVDQILVSDLFETGSSHSKEYESLIVEKNNLLSKMELDDTDRHKLSAINLQLESIPASSNKKDIEAEEIIRKAAQLLKK